MCDCQPNPVRDVLSKSGIGTVESCRDTALSRSEKARKAGDMVSAEMFAKVAQEASRELEGRLLVIAARECLREAGEAGRQARELITQMTS